MSLIRQGESMVPLGLFDAVVLNVALLAPGCSSVQDVLKRCVASPHAMRWGCIMPTCTRVRSRRQGTVAAG
jgi:hypothetical protein